MIEKKKQWNFSEDEIIVAKICDKCGRRVLKPTRDECHQPDIFEYQEFYHINFKGGYGSVFGDGDVVEIDLCQYCLKEIFETYDLWQSPKNNN